MVYTGPSARTIEMVWWRAKGRCERCGATGSNVHHRRPRGMGGTSDPLVNEPGNLLLLCGSGTTGCHGWVESNRQEALSRGFLVPRGVDHPEDVPVLLWRGWALLRGRQYEAMPQATGVEDVDDVDAALGEGLF